MEWLASLGSKLITNLVQGLYAIFQRKKLEAQAAKAESLQKEKESIKAAADKAVADREALEADVKRIKAEPMSDDAFLAGDR